MRERSHGKNRRRMTVSLLIGYVGWTIISSGCPGSAQTKAPKSAQQESTAGVLEAGKPIERQIVGGQSHSYKITAAAGQYLHVVVDQRGIDVVVTLFNSDGKKISETDSPNGSFGPESVVALTEGTGEYRIEVRPFKADAVGGRYEIRLRELRAATEADKTRISRLAAAAEARTAGSELLNKGGPDAPKRAIEAYQKALILWREVGDKYWEAASLNAIGDIYYRLGEKQKALESYNRALSLRHDVGDRRGEATLLNNIGLVYSDLGEQQKALDFFKQALSLERTIGDQSGEATSLKNLGDLYLILQENQKALEAYSQALSLRQVVGGDQTRIVSSIGLIYNSLGEKRKALEYFNQALTLLRAKGDRGAEATMLNNMGSAYDSLGEKQKALDLFNQALPILKDAGDRYGEAACYSNLGLVYYSLGEQQKALEFFNRALPIMRALGDQGGYATTLTNIGGSYIVLGQRQRALEFFSQALPIWRAKGDRRGEATTLNNIANVYDYFGEKEKALEYLSQALPILQALGDRTHQAVTLNNIGSVYLSLGETLKALAYYNQVLPVVRELGDRSQEATTLINMGSAYHFLKEEQKALEFYNQALSVELDIKDRRGEAEARSNIGLVYDSSGEKQKALEYYNQALILRRAVGDRGGEAVTLGNIATTYATLGAKDKAAAFYREALPIARAVGDRRVEAQTLNNLMWLWKESNQALAVFYGKQSVNIYQELRGNIKGLEQQTQKTFLHSVEGSYRTLANLLISHGRLPEAEEVLALLKDEEYSSLRSRGDPKSEVGYSPAETGAVKALDQLGELGREANALRDHKEKKTLDEKGKERLDQIERELLPKVNAEFRRRLAAIELEAPETVIKTAEVKEAQSLMRYLRELGPGTVALYTVVSTEEGKSSKGWVILVTPNFQRAYEMDAADLDQTVASFRQTLRSPAYDPRPLAQKLYRMIFLKQQKEGKTLAEDLEAYLRDQKEKTLMWSLDGVLRYVPMAALHDGQRYLVERYRNVVFTTASLPGLTHATSREWNALGLGVSKQYENFTALSGVPKELSAIVHDNQKHTSGVLSGTIKWDDEFKEKAMMDGLSEGYNVVHIASHFSYQAANPEKSFLLLGDGGHLEMSKIQDLTTLFEKIDLVTLSACDTAVGSAMKDANGKDVEGFAYITQKLGAMAVIASLWPVDDVGTQTLMPRFYSLYQSGLSKGEALRQAQLALLKENNKENRPATTTEQRSSERVNESASSAPGLPFKPDPNAKYSHPYYWAPFILIGNWK